MKNTFEQKFNIALLVLSDLQDVMGDSNYQIYHDGFSWGYVFDGAFHEAGKTLEDLISSLESEIEDHSVLRTSSSHEE